MTRKKRQIWMSDHSDEGTGRTLGFELGGARFELSAVVLGPPNRFPLV
jgi:hypothetical protein